MSASGPSQRVVLVLEQGGRGGVADYTADLVAALHRQGWRVELATATDHLVRVDPAVRIRAVFYYFRGGSPWRDLVRRVGVGRLINAFAYLCAVVALLPAARRATVVHVQGGEFPPLLALASMLMRVSGAPTVLTPHNVFDRGIQWRRSTELTRRLVDRIVLHASADLNALSERTQLKADVIPHGEYGSLARRAGTADRAEARAAIGVPDDAVLALIYGQLRRDKGILDLLAAARRTPELHVLIAGADAGAAHHVRSAAVSGDLEGRLHFRDGHQSPGETAAAFAAADVCVLAYPVASQSGVLLLSYAFATPVVVYPVGGLPEAVRDDETGWVTAAAHPDALATTLRDIVTAGVAECARRGAAGSRFAETHFGWDGIARATTDVYAKAMRA